MRVQARRERRLRHAVADAHPRQAEGLGEGPRHDQVGQAAHPFDAVVALRGRQVLGVGLVEQHRHVRGHRLQKVAQRRSIDEGAGRVVRVGDKDELGVVADGGAHRVQVVAEIARGHDGGARVGVRGGRRIDDETVLRIDDVLARLQADLRRQLENLARSAAQRQPFGRHVEPRGQRLLERGAVAVGVVARTFEGGGGGAAGRLGHAERVFVGSQEDHCGGS
ncbi:hypothetical protein FQZ97_736030 [compost metagenome]